MSAGIKWFVEIIQERSQVSRIEPCGSLREAREIAEQTEAKVDFDPATDCIAIYQGTSWATAKLFE